LIDDLGNRYLSTVEIHLATIVVCEKYIYLMLFKTKK